ncbi:probable serine hydrolase [Anastrepha obliqua]|uniref:probable serine hydrolase n=1 Tax=Anastrepha obliqua TaxID=95512 RepID=UPI00240914D9|nr:probable serine hydrolase [Anastrepha obliqua]
MHRWDKMARSIRPITTALKALDLRSLFRCTCQNKHLSQESLAKGQSSSADFTRNGVTSTRQFEEISIPVPWGHLAGKYYGPKGVRPIIGLHGWQDNAGTYDTLAPLLPHDVGFLSLDLPGHGRSSWLPLGINYHSIDYVTLLLRIMDVFKWDKISMICHSMSSINGFVFSALFPEKVDMMIGLDNLKPLIRSSDQLLNIYAKCIENVIMYEKRTMDSDPPCYDWDQLVQRLHHGTNKSVNLEKCKFLLNRAIQPSQHEPHKYYFSRDNRLKQNFFLNFGEEVPLDMARRIRSPYLFIKALNASYYESRKYFDEALKIMQENPLFEYHEVKGSHHVHLNEPEKVAPIINSFIKKFRHA